MIFGDLKIEEYYVRYKEEINIIMQMLNINRRLYLNILLVDANRMFI